MRRRVFKAILTEPSLDMLTVLSLSIWMTFLSIRRAERNTHHVRLVLERLVQYGLYCNLKKCAFDVDTVNFLGYIISPKGVSMKEGRTRMITEWPVPSTTHEIQVFLGFANFYRRFVYQYARLAAPLNDQTKGDRPQHKRLILPAPAREAFEKLKKAFISAPMLAHYDWQKPTILETDASQVAIAGILSQKQPDGQ